MIFVDAEDYRLYIRLLAMVTVEHGWRLLAFCLMPNHVHLVVETPHGNLSKGMQWLHSQYALAFNKRHGRKGPLFDDRFKSPELTSDEGLVRLVGYVVVNPVAAVLCKRAVDWPWGSHALVNRPDFAPPWLAHKRLVDRLEEITGARCYEQLVATRERAHY